MITVTTKDFADYIAKNELASKPTAWGQVRLEMHTDPNANTIRYVIVTKNHTSRPIKKLAYALDLFNNLTDIVRDNNDVDVIDSMILAANRFA